MKHIVTLFLYSTEDHIVQVESIETNETLWGTPFVFIWIKFKGQFQIVDKQLCITVQIVISGAY